MKKRQKLVTDEQWELIEPLLPEPRRRKDNRDGPGPRIGLVLRAFCGFCRPEQRGDFFLNSFLRELSAGVG